MHGCDVEGTAEQLFLITAQWNLHKSCVVSSGCVHRVSGTLALTLALCSQAALIVVEDGCCPCLSSAFELHSSPVLSACDYDLDTLQRGSSHSERT